MEPSRISNRILLICFLTLIMVILSGCSSSEPIGSVESSVEPIGAPSNPENTDNSVTPVDAPAPDTENSASTDIPTPDDTDKTESSEEGCYGSVELDEGELPLYVYDGISYCIFSDHAEVLCTFFTDETLTSYTVRDSILHEGTLYPVTALYEDAFYGFTEAETITLPDTLTVIGVSAFENCPLLTTIDIPESVTTIGNYAFGDCETLSSIIIPDSVTSLGEAVFFDCVLLKSVQLPTGMTFLPDSFFSGCESLEEFNLPESIVSIGEEAFWYCESLTELVLPSGLVSIGDRCFYDCISLASITLPESLESIGEGLFDFCDELSEIRVPSAKLRTFEDSLAGYGDILTSY